MARFVVNYIAITIIIRLKWKEEAIHTLLVKMGRVTLASSCVAELTSFIMTSSDFIAGSFLFSSFHHDHHQNLFISFFVSVKIVNDAEFANYVFGML